jgi:hypothetical protein
MKANSWELIFDKKLRVLILVCLHFLFFLAFLIKINDTDLRSGLIDVHWIPVF